MLDRANPATGQENPPEISPGGIETTPGWLVRFRAWRAAMVQNPRFRNFAARMPILRQIANRRAEALFSVTSGFVQSQVLFACLDTGLLDLLSKGPVRPEHAANRLQIPQRNFAHLVQSADALGIVRLSRDGWLTLADAGAVVASDHGLAAMIRHHAAFYRDLADPTSLLRGSTGRTEMAQLWSYAGTERDPVNERQAADYSAVMSASQEMLAGEILDAVDLRGVTGLLDVGGGEGIFASAVARHHKAMRIGVFDLPPVADRARQRFSTGPLSGRIECHGGSFLTDALPSGHDAMSLVRVCFDHGDETVIRLMQAIRKALPNHGQLLIAEPMAGSSKGEKLSAAYFAFYFLAMGSGRCRSAEELVQLAGKAGFTRFELRRCRTPMLVSVLVARP